MIAKMKIMQQAHSDCRCRTQIGLGLVKEDDNGMKEFVEGTLGNHHLIWSVPYDEIVQTFKTLGFQVCLF